MPSGPGGNDAEGVYLLGESDLGTGLASDLLNLPAESISLLIRDHRLRLEALEKLPSGVFGRTANFNVSTVAAAVPFQSAPHLVGLGWSAGVDPSHIAAVLAFHGVFSWSSIKINSTASATVSLRINGTTTVPGSTVTVANVAGECVFNNYSVVLDLAPGDYVELMVSISTGTPQPYIAANRVNLDALALR